MKVFSPEIIISCQVDSLNSYFVDAGVDVISSASTDNIDFIVSSASRVDDHGFLRIGYDRKLKNHRNITLGGSGYFSIESDYASLGATLSGHVASNDRSREFSAELETYLDDLRWGRLSGQRTLRLVYPAELRNREWFDDYLRRSINLNLAFRQTINKRMEMSFFPGISYQQGLLSTPFHRVYFKDSSKRVENLPGKRLKIPLGIQLNTFIDSRYILRTYYRFYWDDFGILAHTFNTEFAIKLNPHIILTPLLRLYTQRGASFFKKYRQHDLQENFYTSDYDLSSIQTYEAGTEIRFAGLGKAKKNRYLNDLELRYTYYRRTDRLYAHTITLLMEFISQKKDRK